MKTWGICFDNWDLRNSFTINCHIIHGLYQLYCKTDPIDIQKNIILLKIVKENHDGVANILVLVVYLNAKQNIPSAYLSAGAADDEKCINKK